MSPVLGVAGWTIEAERIDERGEIVRNQAHVSILIAVCLLMVGCSSDQGGDTTAEDHGATTTSSAANVTTTTTGPNNTSTTQTSTPLQCLNPHGGVCLGSLVAGSYTTSSFDPQINYTVPEGWENLEDLPGNFLLQMTNDVRYLGIYQNVRAPAECDEAWAEDVGGTVEDLAAWYRAHPGLTTTEPEDVNVGGLSGVFLDVSLNPSWDVTCPYSAGQPVVPFIIGNGTSELHHVILPGFEERLYLLEWNGGNVAIEVGPEGSSLDEYLVEVLPILESVSFGT